MLLPLTHLYCGLILIRFVLSKLFSWPVSVAAFIEMAKPLGVDPTFFRFFTGACLAVVVIGYFSSLYPILRGKHLESRKALLLVRLSNFLGIGMMTGALLAEFILRTEPKIPLVVIALSIVAFSARNLASLKDVRPQE